MIFSEEDLKKAVEVARLIAYREFFVCGVPKETLESVLDKESFYPRVLEFARSNPQLVKP